jgi:hypothetical protein
MTSFPTLCIHYYDTTRVMGRKVRPGIDRRPIIDSYSTIIKTLLLTSRIFNFLTFYIVTCQVSFEDLPVIN